MNALLLNVVYQPVARIVTNARPIAVFAQRPLAKRKDVTTVLFHVLQDKAVIPRPAIA